jgi:type II secretory pathway component PulK
MNPIRILTRPRGTRRRRRSGIALLVAISTVMVLTVVVTEMSYNARVRFLIAAHEKERAQAYWVSQTGINMYKLILSANKQMEGSAVGGLAESAGLNIGDALWQWVPVINTGLMRMLFASGGDIDDDDIDSFKQTGKVSDEIDEASRDASKFSDKNFLDFDGDFSAEVTDEDAKLNVSMLANAQGSVHESAIGKQLYGLMAGEENDAWFRDRNIDRWDIIGNLKDWVDPDTMGSGRSGGQEDSLYNNRDSPYLSKNAAFDTFDEIRLVEGWQDDVMDRFGHQLTIHGTGKININTAPDEVLFALIQAYIVPAPMDQECVRLIEQIREYMWFATFNNGKDFAKYLTNQGYTVSDQLQNQIGKSSKTFRVISTGLVGDTSVTTTAIIDYNGSQAGQVTYWRVD